MSMYMQREFARLKQHLLTLSAECERAIENAESALLNMDVELARKVVEYDQVIDRHEVDVEEECLKVMALYQPVAADLRQVVAILKMNNDLERIADLAGNIGEYVQHLAVLERVEIPERITVMFREARKMVHDSLDCLVSGDAELARRVLANDAVVDELNVAVINEIADHIRQHPDKVRPLLLLVSVSRNLERIADYATNISEDVVYMVRGVIIRHRLTHTERLTPGKSEGT